VRYRKGRAEVRDGEIRVENGENRRQKGKEAHCAKEMGGVP